MNGFCKQTYLLDGLNLVWPDQVEINQIAHQLAKQDPWKTLNISAASLVDGMSAAKTMNTAWAVKTNGNCVGVVTIKPDWLLGPYLNLIGLLPEAQGLNIGTKILQWMQHEGKVSNARNLYLCVSDFNLRAQNLYRSFGFRDIGTLDSLICEGHAEILMRKSLF